MMRQGNLYFGLVLCFLIYMGRISAATYNVPTDFYSIQAAIDFSTTNGDTILVANGIYDENLNITVADYNNSRHVILIGEDRDSTIINGYNTAGLSVIKFDNYSQSVLSGFTIKSDGYNSQSASEGGGIYCDLNSKPTLENLIISDNHATEKGGGIYLHYSDAIIENVIIKDNTAQSKGAGIYINNSQPTISHVTIHDNYSDYYM